MVQEYSGHLNKLLLETIETTREPWIEEIKELVRDCPDVKNLAKAIRYYAYHYDTYLNAATRNRPFWKKKLINHFVDDMLLRNDQTIPSIRDPKTHKSYQKPASFLLDEIDDEDYTIELENSCSDVTDPIEYLPYTEVHPQPLRRLYKPSYADNEDYEQEFSIRNKDRYDIEKDPNFHVLFDYYLATIKHHILFMFHTFTAYAIPTMSPRRLYRCMVVEEGKDIEPFTGCTSTTYYLPSTFSILGSILESVRHKTEKGATATTKTYTNVVLVMDVPEEIYYLPSAICTLYSDENEIILLSQCSLIERVGERETVTILIDDIPVRIEFRYGTLRKDKNLPTLHPFQLTDDMAYWGKKNKNKQKKTIQKRQDKTKKTR
jgi:hypothetical protein